MPQRSPASFAADDDEAPPPLASLPGQREAVGSAGKPNPTFLTARPPATVTDGAGAAVRRAPAAAAAPQPTTTTTGGGLLPLPVGALAAMAGGDAAHRPRPPPGLLLSPAAAARAKGLLSPTEGTLRSVLADPALVDLLTDPAVSEGAAAIQAAPDPAAALRAAVGSGDPVGDRLGQLFARLAGLAAARCEAVAVAEEEADKKEKEKGKTRSEGGAAGPGIVALP